jgi:CheY-like chemotaxis protein
MDGLEAIRRIRAMSEFQRTPIIAVTALVMEGDRELCLLAGADEYVSKPVRLRNYLT